MRTLVDLLRLAKPPVTRLALAVLLGATAVLTGVGLMTLAGYLISRCAEHPPVLSLTMAIVGVRAFGITRPLARYAERLVSHDLALRVLGRTRAVAVGSLAGKLPDRAGRYRDGDLLTRLVGDIDGVQDLFLRALSPPLVALLSGAVSVVVATALLPVAGLVLAAGLIAGGVLLPALAALAAGGRTPTGERPRRAHGRARRARARGAGARGPRCGPCRSGEGRTPGCRAEPPRAPPVVRRRPGGGPLGARVGSDRGGGARRVRESLPTRAVSTAC